MRSNRQGLLAVTLMLVAIGVVMVYSTSAVYAQENYGDALFFLKRHLIYLTLGLGVSLWILSLKPEQIQKAVRPMMLLFLVALALVLVPGIGHKVSGATRWFRLGPISVQPSEFAQVGLILYLADALTRKRPLINNFFHGVLPLFLVMGLTIGLILLEPDLGTSVATATVCFVLLFVSGIRSKMWSPMILAGIPTFIALVLAKPYRMRRIVGFFNPWGDPEGAGFQLIQSLVALGSGGLLGVGLGESRQKLFYLPAAHTDFIFSVIGEELGLLGTSVVLILFVLLAWFGLRAAMHSPRPFGTYVGVGVICLLMLEGLVHMGVTTGMLPTKGLPLPFISYGGTALIVNLMSIALLLNVTRPEVKPE